MQSMEPSASPSVQHTSGIMVRYYSIESDIKSIPDDLDTMIPHSIDTVRTVAYSKSVNVPFATSNLITKVAATFQGWLAFPEMGTYKLCVASDDEADLYIDGIQLYSSEGMCDSNVEECCVNFSPVNEKHFVKLNFLDYGGEHRLFLRWEKPGSSEERVAIPARYWSLPISVKYYDAMYWGSLPDAGLSGLTPYRIDTTAEVNYPGIDVSDEEFATSERSNFVAALFQGYVDVDPRANEICVTSDDGSKLYLDDVLMVNNDGLHGSVMKCASVSKEATYKLDLEYFESEGDATCILEWFDGTKYWAVTPQSKFYVKYYDAWGWRYLPHMGLSNRSPYKTDTTDEISFSSSRGKFATSGKNNHVGALFEGYLYVDPSIWSICITSDDGSKLYLDDVLKVNNDGLHGSIRKCAFVSEGTYKLDLEYFEAGGSAECILEFYDGAKYWTIPPTSWRFMKN